MEKHFVSSFLSCLKVEICNEIQLFRPIHKQKPYIGNKESNGSWSLLEMQIQNGYKFNILKRVESHIDNSKNSILGAPQETRAN